MVELSAFAGSATAWSKLVDRSARLAFQGNFMAMVAGLNGGA